MRASRLISLLMLLQTRGRMTAEALAGEFEVSVRTIYRDIDHLSAAGVPVYADRGPSGGFALLDGYRTKLTGMTAAEAETLFLAGLPGPAAELGLAEIMATAQLKLLAALPPALQQQAERVAARFHLDPVGWFRDGDAAATVHLRALADAVWNARPVRMVYKSWQKVSERELMPRGLILKSGVWYMAAQTIERTKKAARCGEMRSYRVGNIQTLAALDSAETFPLPKDFDLASWWMESSKRFEAEILTGTATLRITPRGLRWLRDIAPAMYTGAEQTLQPADAEGWHRVTIPIEEGNYAAGLMLRLEDQAEVLAPPALREAVMQKVQRLREIYESPGAA